VVRSKYPSKINAILLDDGRVLVTGGFFIDKDSNTRGYLNVCEIYDPSTNKWSLTDTLKSKRAGHTITKLNDGRILVAGGFNEDELSINKCEIFDPNTNTWSSGDTLNFSRNAHSAILLPNGKVLVAGGKDDVNPTEPWLSSCELYDPDKDEWSVVGSLSVSRTDAKVFAVSDNLIMFVGGVQNARLWELYDTNKFESVYLNGFPVDKFDQEILITKDSSIISIAGSEVDTSDELPLLFVTNKCEIYKFGLTNIYEENHVPQNYKLNQNYPNPFNPVTTINYQLPKAGTVTLKIFDILGKEVKTLVNEQKDMGRYTAQFDASSLASGMYVYQLRVNDYIAVKKMMLVK